MIMASLREKPTFKRKKNNQKIIQINQFHTKQNTKIFFNTNHFIVAILFLSV